MKTEIINSKDDEELAVKKAADVIKNGGLVVFPTETVYGLGANAMDSSSSSKIYEAKGRPSDNPLIVHISNLEMLENIVTEIDERAKKIIDGLWPGPLTIIFDKKYIVPLTTTGGLNTVAVRFPSHSLAQKIIDKSAVPLAAPSANISGKPSITDEKSLIEELDGKVDLIILGGDSPIGLESTVIDLTEKKAKILRPGFIEANQIAEVIGEEIFFDSNLKNPSDPPKSPGMKYKHYSPNCEIFLVTGDKKQQRNKIFKSLEQDKKEKIKSCILSTYSFESTEDFANINLGKTNEEIAKNLFKTFRNLDGDGFKKAYLPYIYEGKLAASIMDRAKKAAEYKFL